jgi:Smg protein
MPRPNSARSPGPCAGSQFLESVGVLNASDREVVIDRFMALADQEVGLEQTKLIVLMVLWNQGQRPDSLVFDQLRTPERSGLLH